MTWWPWIERVLALLGLSAAAGGGGAGGGGSGLGVVWYAPIMSGGGYCSEAIAFLQSLEAASVPVKAIQHGDSYSREFLAGLPADLQSMFHRTVARDAWAIPPKQWARSVSVCHSEPGAWHPSRWPTTQCPPGASNAPDGVAYRVGRTMFETDRLPAGWDERLNKMDEVWVPTEFHRRIFAAGGVEPAKLVVLGEPVDTVFFDPKQVATADLMFPTSAAGAATGGGGGGGGGGGSGGSPAYRFLSVFKWEDRKGWDVLLRAFFLEFVRSATPDVVGKDDEADDDDDSGEEAVLYLLTNPYHDDGKDFDDRIQEYAKQVFAEADKGARRGSLGARRRRLPAVRVIPRDRPQRLLPALYASFDCLVQPSRGEGWGRPHAEAMSMGLPVIATNWSGTTAFLTEANGYPLRYEGLEPVKEGAFKGHLWATPSTADLRRLLRHVVEHKDEAAEKGRRARRDMVRRFAPRVLGEEVKAHLARIESKLAAAAAAAAAAGDGGGGDATAAAAVETDKEEL